MDAILYLTVMYVIFKLGEYYSYFKISRNMNNVKALSTQRVIVEQTGILSIERINDQYYAFLDNVFIGQSKNFDEIKNISQEVITQNKQKYSTVKVEVKE